MERVVADDLKWICGFANAQGGKLELGCNDKGVLVGLPDAKRLLSHSIYYIHHMENSKSPENFMEDELVASILKLQVSQPANYDWKEDYARALEEKYENIYRR